ncbi:MAG TPA: hypothetical protein VF214_00705 [Edaphobacter sp.]
MEKDVCASDESFLGPIVILGPNRAVYLDAFGDLRCGCIAAGSPKAAIAGPVAAFELGSGFEKKAGGWRQILLHAIRFVVAGE